jgi:hypothetical protein
MMASKGGYALPAVLTIVTILTLIYMVCILALENLRSETVAAVQSAELERVALSAEAQFTFLASTEALGPNALQIGAIRQQLLDIPVSPKAAATSLDSGNRIVTPLRLDGKPYLWSEAPNAVSNPYVLSVQDAAGMVNLDRIDQAAMQRLLHFVGVDAEVSEQIAAKFDGYRRAVIQTSQEKAEGPIRPLATNGLLRRYSEIFGVKDMFSRLTSDQKRRLMALTTVQPDTSTLNINTASDASLQTWFGINASDAAEIISRRKNEIFSSPRQIGVNLGEDFGTYTFPSGRFRYSLSSAKGQTSYSSFIVLTPGSFERPFWVEDVRVQTFAHPLNQRTDELQPFPSIPDLAPALGRPS